MNPSYAINVNTISSRAPSTTQPTLHQLVAVAYPQQNILYSSTPDLSIGKMKKINKKEMNTKKKETIQSLEEMKEAGITSYKIEGRLKDIGYVKNIVSYYKQKLGKGCSSGKSHYSFTPNPEKSFNRGFTEYFLKGRTDCFNQESPKSKGEYLK